MTSVFNRFHLAKAEDVPVSVVDEKKNLASDVESDPVAPVASAGGDEKRHAPILTAEAIAADGEDFTPGAQAGIHDIEAITSVWTKKELIIAYIMIWFIYFVDTMQQGTTGSLLAYVTSSFNKHSTLAATGIVSNIVGGLWKLPLAKIIDVFGRPQGYLLMICCLTLGLIIMAATDNVETYAAGQVFYWVGYNGLVYVLGIFVADTSKLKNRAFMFAYINTPYLATTWIGGPLATAYLKGPGWRWAFGSFTIITPAVTLPLYFLFMRNYKKAEAAGLIKKVDSGRTWQQSLIYYAVEFDVVGLFLICAGLALFLLPFSLYSYQQDQWNSAMIISMIIIGGLLIIAFVVWERFYAPVTFIPYELLKDRTVFGACILAGCLFISFYCWNAYFFSFLIVVQDLSITHTSYIQNIYTIGSCFFALIVGLLIRYTGRFKWIAVYFGVPITILGVGLMIHFRQPDINIGYVIMCQVFIALGGGALVITEQMAAMAATSHQYVAVVLAIEGMFSSVGGGIGLAVSAAIWTSVFPKQLAQRLPESALPNIAAIYGQLGVQQSYPIGSPERIAINAAYGEAQKAMCIAATAILIVGVVGTAMWRDIKVKEFRQVKGTVI